MITEQGTQVLLFVREYKEIKNRAEPYTCLGTATYVRHEGSRPMPPRLLEKALKMSV